MNKPANIDAVFPVPHSYDSMCLPPWHIQQIIAYARRQKVSPQRLLEGLDITEADLADPDFRVSFRQTYEFVRHSFEYFDSRLLGAEVTKGVRPSSFGLVGVGISASPNVVSAAHFSIENRMHFGPMMHIEFTEGKDECSLEMAPVYPADDLLVYLCDRFASSALALLTVLRKSMVENTKIDFPFGREESLSQFAEDFGCQVRFDQPRFKISMLTVVGKTELPNADQILWSQITTTLAKNMPSVASESEVVIKVRRYIQANLGEAELNVAKVAASMFMSERTLRRRLTEHDTSFREVLSQEREKRARDLLVTGKLSMTDIAVICGYADTSSLRRCLSNSANEDS